MISRASLIQDALPEGLVRVLDALRSTYPTNLSGQPAAFELAVGTLLPLELVLRHGAWRFTLTAAGVRALRRAQMQRLLDHVADVNAKQRAPGRALAPVPRGAFVAQLTHLAQREWRGIAARSAGFTPDLCLFKAACLALVALLHEGEDLEEVGRQWIQEVEALDSGDRFDPHPTTRTPVDWGVQVAFHANLWRVSPDRTDFRTSMLRVAALAFLGWFHLRRTRWALSPEVKHPRRSRPSRATK